MDCCDPVKPAGEATRHDVMKHCPGNRCGLHLPRFQFSGNINMKDGLDSYCVECNLHRRMENKRRRERNYQRNRLSQGQRPPPQSFSSFAEAFVNRKEQTKNRVLGKISRCVERSEHPVPFTPMKIYDKLFSGRRMKCHVTRRPITPECFLDHHEIHAECTLNFVYLKCNKVSPP